jgi:serine phosphatase RsbU (regulator of sigma subunit)
LRDDGSIERLESKSVPLGAQEIPEIASLQTQLHPKDRVFLFSDGLIEQPFKGGGTIGLRRLQKCLQETRKLELNAAGQFIRDWFETQKDGAIQDDITFTLLAAK